MKFTYNWLKDYLDTTASPREIAVKLTEIGLEVEKITYPGEALKDFIIATISKTVPHPQADKLQICDVKVSEKQTFQVICGAPNARSGIKVVFASPGTHIPEGNFMIKPTKIRGVESIGMLCSMKELGLGNDHEGIIELPENAPIGTSYADYLNLDDPVFEIGITPNRGDCLGVRGIARDLAAAGLGKLKKQFIPKLPSQFTSPIQVTNQLPAEKQNACNHFTGCYIKGVTNKPSPQWLQQRLESIGLSPISALVDITNYLNHDLGRPLHVFDADKIDGQHLNIRMAKKGESLDALNHETYQLDDEMTVIADAKAPAALGGIIGGENTGCTMDTTNVFIEAAYFDPIRTAITGRKLGVHTDARYCFERGVDPLSTVAGTTRAAAMILELCGGEPSHILEVGQAIDNQKTILLIHDNIQKRTGVHVDKTQVISYLQKIGCTVHEENKQQLTVTTPTWRHDLAIAEDLIEEIIRLHGYGHIPHTPLPTLKEANTPLNITQQSAQKARYTLAEKGYNEVVTWSMVDQQAADIFGPISEKLRLRNPISQDLLYMRPSILPTLLHALQVNWDHGHRSLSFFEVGPTYHNNTPQGQKLFAAGVRLGKAHLPNWSHKDRPFDVYDIKDDIKSLLSLYGISDKKYQLSTNNLPSWYHPGRAVVICQGPKRILGVFGEIHPVVLKAYGLKSRVVAFEVNLDMLPAPKTISHNKGLYQRARFQKVERDFAFIMPKDVAAGDVLDCVQKVAPQLIHEVTVFDVFDGEGIASDKKSLSIHVTLQPQDGTLKEEEIKKVYDEIIHTVETKTGALLRL